MNVPKQYAFVSARARVCMKLSTGQGSGRNCKPFTYTHTEPRHWAVLLHPTPHFLITFSFLATATDKKGDPAV